MFYQEMFLPVGTRRQPNTYVKEKFQGQDERSDLAVTRLGSNDG